MTLRVPKAELPAEFREELTKQFGAVPEPVEVLWHSPSAAMASLDFSGKVGAWDAVDESLKTFAHMAVAAQVGCDWCLDISYFFALNQDLDVAKASQRRTCCRSPGCGGPRSTSRRYVTHGHTSSGS